ncbi:hypothetical protein J5X84_28860 [Streptosporangiaceae bacterium NEAU-GS5]|nr:hypothetical protein [Streptosporangiaceae bacterium NEAU-GS5]
MATSVMTPEQTLPKTILRGPWQECTLTRINELRALSEWAYKESDQAAKWESIYHATHRHLDRARDAVQKTRSRYLSFNGTLLESADSNIDAAEANLLRMAPKDYLIGQLPSLIVHVNRHLPANDPRLQEFHALLRELKDPAKCTDAARTQLIAVVRAASSEASREIMAVRQFRNVLMVVAMALTTIAVLVAAVGLFAADWVPICFTPQRGTDLMLVCPTGEQVLQVNGKPAQLNMNEAIKSTAHPQDLLILELLGAVSGAVAGAVSLQRLRVNSGSLGLPVALAMLKLPFGALTAFVGLLLMRGQFVPGLSALDSSAQIIAWAVLFGSSQQVFTRLVDQQAQAVVSRVRGAQRTGRTRSR